MQAEMEPYHLNAPSWRLPLHASLGGSGAGGSSSSSNANATSSSSASRSGAVQGHQPQQGSASSAPPGPSSGTGGIPDFFPPTLSAHEFDLGEGSVRNGLSARPAVGNETFSAHDMIYDRLRAPSILAQLHAFIDEAHRRRDELQRERIAPSSHRLPSRVTLNDSKLAAYVRDLADPAVPLTRLARSVPHGFRGEKMLEMLYTGSPTGLAPAPTPAAAAQAGGSSSAAAAAPPAPLGSSSGGGKPGTPGASGPSTTAGTTASSNSPGERDLLARGRTIRSGASSVPLGRALWFVQVVGATDVQANRNKAAQIQLDWSNALCAWMRKQLAELQLPAHAAEALLREATAKEESSWAGASAGAGAGAGSASQIKLAAGVAASNSGASASTPVQGRNAGGPIRQLSTASTAPPPAALLQSPGRARPPAPLTPGRAAASGSTSSISSSGPGAEGLPVLFTTPTQSIERWAHKWSYALALQRGLQDACLLHVPTYLRFAGEALGAAHFVQLPYALALVRGCAPFFARGSLLATGLVEAALKARSVLRAAERALAKRPAAASAGAGEAEAKAKTDPDAEAAWLDELDAPTAAAAAAAEKREAEPTSTSTSPAELACSALVASLDELLLSMVRADAQCLISPRLWAVHGPELRSILSGADVEIDLVDVEERIAALTLERLVPQGVSRLSVYDQEVDDIAVSMRSRRTTSS